MSITGDVVPVCAEAGSAQTAVWPDRAEGAFVVLIVDQVSAAGLYRIPALVADGESEALIVSPPQTTISDPVQIAECPDRLVPTVRMKCHESDCGSYSITSLGVV